MAVITYDQAMDQVYQKINAHASSFVNFKDGYLLDLVIQSAKVGACEVVALAVSNRSRAIAPDYPTVLNAAGFSYVGYPSPSGGFSPDERKVWNNRLDLKYFLAAAIKIAKAANKDINIEEPDIFGDATKEIDAYETYIKAYTPAAPNPQVDE
ncbi:hypothetical protein [Vibrio parahaemolyticus]|uniref:hypothetical protein n=1 Tax=Vibrio parahaemolyticus TaxID=670 RepID=UPI00226B8AA1|nr:hypothetical protein [Vibrio parahaemolyticus]MCX8941276.1 hypothetical protein [Vibrio parahaemolyticus]